MIETMEEAYIKPESIQTQLNASRATLQAH